MKFDKETLVVVVLCVVLLLGWAPFCRYMGWIKTPENNPPAATADTGTPAAADTAKDETASTDKSGETAATEETKKVVPESTNLPKIPTDLKMLDDVSLSNDLVKLTVNPNRGDVVSIELLKMQNSDNKTNITLEKEFTPGALSVYSRKQWGLLDVKVNASKDSIIVTRKFRKDKSVFSVIQTWILEKNYKIAYSIFFRNEGTAPLEFDDLTVSAGGMRPLQYLCGDVPRRENHTVMYCVKNDEVFKSINADADDEDYKEAKTSDPLLWVGVSNKFFANILIPKESFTDGITLERTKLEAPLKADSVPFVIKMFNSLFGRTSKASEYYIPTAAGSFDSFEIPAGGEKEFAFTYYAGPKELPLLEGLGPKTTEVIQLAWWSKLEWIAQALLYFLNYLKNNICGSYGWSIILLTVIVKLVFWPVTQKANKSMRKMQVIQPLVKELREKYKSDPQAMNAEMMKLYKENGVNPLGGCLPILLQMPVFFALISTLDGAVELRHTPFLWASDLTLPDAVGPVIMGYQLHPLAITMTALMILQMRLSPSSADPVQQKMMMAMPLVMLFLFYNMPSGLTLYWTVSQGISIIQLLINQRLNKDGEVPKSGAAVKTTS